MATSTENFSDGMKRMRFFDGLFLTENEFNLEQKYIIDTLRLHQRSFHGWGIVSGLEVVKTEYNKVKVVPGVAIALLHKNNSFENTIMEQSGAFIVKTKETELTVLSTNEASSRTYVVMEMNEHAVDKNVDIGGEEFIYIQEEPEISLKGIVDWKKNIVLAALEFNESTFTVKYEIEIDEITRNVRHYAGFYGKVVQTDRLVLSHPDSDDCEESFAEMRGIHLDNNNNGITIESSLTRHEGDMGIFGNMEISGDVNAGSDEEPSEVDINGSIHLHGISGEEEITRLLVDGASEMHGSLHVGEIEMPREVIIDGKVLISGNDVLDDTHLLVDGNCQVSGSTKLGSGTQMTTIDGDLDCTNNATIQGNVIIGIEDSNSPKNLDVFGDCNIHDDLEVTSETRLKGDTTIGDNKNPIETRIYGGFHIGPDSEKAGNKNLIVDGDCTIKGNLNLLRTITETKASEVLIDDNIITLNKYPEQKTPANINGGIEVFRGGTEPKAQLIWDEVDDKWKIGLENSLQNIGYGPDWDDLINGDFADHLHRHNVLFSENSKPESLPTLKIDTEGNTGIGLPKTGKPESVLHLYKSSNPALTIQSQDNIEDVAGRIRIRQGEENGVDLLYDAHRKVDVFSIKMFQKNETEGFTSLIVENDPNRRGFVGIGAQTAKERLHIAKGNLLVEDGNCIINDGNLTVNGTSEFTGNMTIGKQSEPAKTAVNGNLQVIIPDRTKRALDVTGGSFLNGGVDIEGNLNVGPDTLVVLHEGTKPVVNVGGDCVINGDLTVLGRNAFVTAETVEIKDSTLLLNRFDGPKIDWRIAGIEIFRGSGLSLPKILWSEAEQKWLIGVNNVNDTTGLSEIISGANSRWQTLTNHSNADTLHTHSSLWQEVTRGISYNDGNVGIGTSKEQPKARLQVNDGAIMPSAGNTEQSGIIFPKDPYGGGGDAAWIRYYQREGENTTLEIGTSNDAQDNIALISSGGVGVGTRAPQAQLHISDPSSGRDSFQVEGISRFGGGTGFSRIEAGQLNIEIGGEYSYAYVNISNEGIPVVVATPENDGAFVDCSVNFTIRNNSDGSRSVEFRIHCYGSGIKNVILHYVVMFVNQKEVNKSTVGNRGIGTDVL